MNTPKLLIRFFPVPGVDWVGNVRITCQETGLGAELCYQAPSLIGRNRRSIKGKIIDLSSSKTLYEVDGHWDNTVTVKDVRNGKQKVIYNATEIISGLKTPQVKDTKVIETLPPYLYAQDCLWGLFDYLMSMHCHATPFLIPFNTDVINLSCGFKWISDCVEQPLLGHFVERIGRGLERS